MNICSHRGIGVRDVSREADGSVLLRVKSADFKRLRPIAYKTHTKIHIVKKRGFFNLKKRYGGRWFFMAGAVMFAAFFIAAPQYIWTVEISGTEDTAPEEIERTLREMGIYRGAPKRNIPDGFEIKRRILNAYPDIAWAWVYINGTTADARIYEKAIAPQTVDRQEPCDIIAACDGYIEKIDVLNGESEFSHGGAVSAGDTIISGRVAVYKEGYPEKYMYVHAMGKIRAYTQRQKSGIYPLYREARTPTGKTETKYYLDLFGKRANLYRGEEPSFAEYAKSERVRDFYGITLGKIIYDEAEISYEPMSVEAVAEIAKNDLEEKIAKELCADAELQGEDLRYEKVSENEIKVKLTMSFTEDIGVETPLERNEEHIDKQED